jgi:hypothetical protein
VIEIAFEHPWIVLTAMLVGAGLVWFSIWVDSARERDCAEERGE